MKAYLISDNIDTLVGMRLAGIEGVIAHSEEETVSKIDEVISNKEIGIILITERLADKVSDKIQILKLKMTIPLIVEIPDRHGTSRGKDSITRYVKESIGLKM
jgi:V/A-type H+-transporting ATPase subunit F